jgi:uncharacterized protein (DUF58 family)
MVLTFIRRFAYHAYRRSYAIKQWYGHKFTTVGALTALLLIGSSVLGLDTAQTTAHMIFTFLFVLLAVASALTWKFSGLFEIKRVLPRFVIEGEPFTYKMTISNHTGAGLVGASISDNPSDPRPGFDEFLKAMAQGNGSWEPFEMIFGFQRWSRLLESREIFLPKRKDLPVIPPGEEVVVSLEGFPERRGIIRFEGAPLASADPFGILRRLKRIASTDSVVCLPRQYRMPPLPLPGIRKYHLGGVALASDVGDSEEFVSLRDYRAGDPLRIIHWRSWAKVGKPVVKEYEEEFYSRNALVLDSAVNFSKDRIFEEAVSVAASFVASYDTRDSILDMMFVGNSAYCLSAGRGLGDEQALLEALATVTAGGEESFDSLTQAVFDRMPIVSGFVLALTSWDERRRAFVSRLLAEGAILQVIVIAESGDRDALNLGPMAGQPDRFHVFAPGEVEKGPVRL